MFLKITSGLWLLAAVAAVALSYATDSGEVLRHANDALAYRALCLLYFGLSLLGMSVGYALAVRSEGVLEQVAIGLVAMTVGLFGSWFYMMCLFPHL